MLTEVLKQCKGGKDSARSKGATHECDPCVLALGKHLASGPRLVSYNWAMYSKADSWPTLDDITTHINDLNGEVVGSPIQAVDTE